MSSKQWKSYNTTSGVRVTQKIVNEMNQRGSFSANIKHFKANKPTAAQKEGLYRFYGRDKVNAALTGKKQTGTPSKVSISEMQRKRNAPKAAAAAKARRQRVVATTKKRASAPKVSRLPKY